MKGGRVFESLCVYVCRISIIISYIHVISHSRVLSAGDLCDVYVRTFQRGPVSYILPILTVEVNLRIDSTTCMQLLRDILPPGPVHSVSSLPYLARGTGCGSSLPPSLPCPSGNHTRPILYFYFITILRFIPQLLVREYNDNKRL